MREKLSLITIEIFVITVHCTTLIDNSNVFYSDQWEKASEFPEALTSVACCSLRLPNTTLQELTRDKYKIATMETDSLEEVHT